MLTSCPPTDRRATQDISAGSSGATDARSADVFLVEDNPDHVELTLRALRRYNPDLSVGVARDGVEALECLFGTRGSGDGVTPRVILLDLKLPLVDGLEVLAKVKADDRTRNVPVVVLTSSLQESDRDESRRLGAVEYISKPVSTEKLANVLSKIDSF